MSTPPLQSEKKEVNLATVPAHTSSSSGSISSASVNALPSRTTPVKERSGLGKDKTENDNRNLKQVLMLKGHTKPVTTVRYNREGDLLFSCAKDAKPCVWLTETGERLGTFNGHEGAVWDIDVNYFSTRVLTGSSDKTAKLWDAETGTVLHTFDHRSGVRCARFSDGDWMILTVGDNTFSQKPSIYCYNLEADLRKGKEDGEEKEAKTESTSDQCARILTVEEGETGADNALIHDALWGTCNTFIYSCHSDGSLRVWDTETGKQVSKIVEHKNSIHSIQFSKDKTMLLTASFDKTAKLFDTKSMRLIKTYQSDRPLRSAAISPTMDHVIVGGGQDVASVTTTSSRAGHFDIEFHHTVYKGFLGSVKGHFGPIHSLAFHPEGKSFASASEDGYVRYHLFGDSYFKTDPIEKTLA